MNEQLAIKRSMQLMSLFGTANSSKDLLDVEPNVRKCCVYLVMGNVSKESALSRLFGQGPI